MIPWGGTIYNLSRNLINRFGLFSFHHLSQPWQDLLTNAVHDMAGHLRRQDETNKQSNEPGKVSKSVGLINDDRTGRNLLGHHKQYDLFGCV